MRIADAMLKKLGRPPGRAGGAGPVLQCHNCDETTAVTEAVMAVVTAGRPIRCAHCGFEFQRWSPD